MSPQEPRPSNCQENLDREPGRTPGKAEGDETDVPPAEQDRSSGPAAAKRETQSHAEPKRTPGKAEG